MKGERERIGITQLISEPVLPKTKSVTVSGKSDVMSKPKTLNFDSFLNSSIKVTWKAQYCAPSINKRLHKKKMLQLMGFKKSIILWIFRSTKSERRFVLPHQHLDKFLCQNFYPLDLHKMPKAFKSFLAWNFSYYMNQDLPDSIVKVPLTDLKILSMNLTLRLIEGKEGKFLTNKFSLKSKGNRKRTSFYHSLVASLELCGIYFKVNPIRSKSRKK